MSLIDLKKLNAEVDELIKKSDAEVRNFERKITDNKEYKFNEFKKTMIKYRDLAREIGRDISVVTDLRSHYRDNYVLTIRTYGDVHIGLTGGAGLDCFLLNRTFEETERQMKKYSGLTAEPLKILNWWCSNKDKFEKAFEVGCINAIKRKVERANARHEAARKELADVTEY